MNYAIIGFATFFRSVCIAQLHAQLVHSNKSAFYITRGEGEGGRSKSISAHFRGKFVPDKKCRAINCFWII